MPSLCVYGPTSPRIEMTEQYRYRCLAVAWCNHCAISVISPLCRSDNLYTRGVRGEDEECAAVLKVRCGAQMAIYTGPNSPVIQLNRVWHLNCAAALDEGKSVALAATRSKGRVMNGRPSARMPSAAVLEERASESIPVDQISFLYI